MTCHQNLSFAQNLHICFVKSSARRQLKLPTTLKELKRYWSNHKIKGYDFRHFEVALLRFAKEKNRDKKYFLKK